MTPSEQRAEELARGCLKLVLEHPLIDTPWQVLSDKTCDELTTSVKQTIPLAQYEACVEALRRLQEWTRVTPENEDEMKQAQVALTSYDTFMKERNKR